MLIPPTSNSWPNSHLQARRLPYPFCPFTSLCLDTLKTTKGEGLGFSMTLGVSMLDAKNQCRVRRKKSQTEDFNRFEQHLSLCKRPVAGAGDRE